MWMLLFLYFLVITGVEAIRKHRHLMVDSNIAHLERVADFFVHVVPI